MCVFLRTRFSSSRHFHAPGCSVIGTHLQKVTPQIPMKPLAGMCISTGRLYRTNGRVRSRAISHRQQLTQRPNGARVRDCFFATPTGILDEVAWLYLVTDLFCEGKMLLFNALPSLGVSKMTFTRHCPRSISSPEPHSANTCVLVCYWTPFQSLLCYQSMSVAQSMD